MSGSEENVRLLLVNNPLTSLFMGAWLNQMNDPSDSSSKNIAVYCPRELDESYSTDITLKIELHDRACSTALKHLVTDWLVCEAWGTYRKHDQYRLEQKPISRLFRERGLRKRELMGIKRVLTAGGVSLDSVKEIWYGNTFLTPHFFDLCPTAKGVSFEHGLSEVSQAVNFRKHLSNNGTPSKENGHRNLLSYLYINPVRAIRSIVIRFLWNLTLPFPSKNVHMLKHVSLLGGEISKANHEVNIETLSGQETLRFASDIMKNDPSGTKLANITGKTALILLLNVKPWAKTKNIHMSFFSAYQDYLMSTYKELWDAYGIKNLVFKTKFFHEEYARDGFESFSKLAESYNLHFLTEYSELNYPTEYYISVLRPVVIQGASSALFYARKMTENTMTFTDEDWFVGYCMREFGKTFPDFSWMKMFFHDTHRRSFCNVLPESITSIDQAELHLLPK